MINPYTRSDRSIAADLKIFIGKREEISQLEIQNKIVDKKWYLAWDTGEFFVANSLRKLVRYGGSANNLSKEDINKMIDSYTTEELTFIRKQLTEALKNYNEIKKLISDLDYKLDSSLEAFEKRTTEYIIKKIDEVIANGESLTYSKEQIDNKIKESKESVLSSINDLYINKTELSKYALIDNVNSSLQNKMTILSGDDIQVALDTNQNGYYFCILDSINGTFEVGHTYRIYNSSFEDITAAGSGTGYLTPEISLSINGKTKIIKEICSNFNDVQTFRFTVSNPKIIKGNLSFYENLNKISSIDMSPALTGSFQYRTTLANLNIGEYVYTLSGEDKKGNIIQGNAILKIIAPIYFGTTKNIIPNKDSILTGNKILSEYVNRTYTFAPSLEDYLYIAVPDNLTVKKLSMQGFEIPINKAEKIVIPFGNYNITYNYYRTKTAADAGILDVDII